MEVGELLGGWQPESRIYIALAKREIATADLIATDTASHTAHADGGAMTVPLETHSRGTYLYCIVIHFHIELIFHQQLFPQVDKAATSCISKNIPSCQKSAVSE